MASVKHVKDNTYRVFFCINRTRSTMTIQAKTEKQALKMAVILENNIKETGSIDGITIEKLQKTMFPDLIDEYLEHMVTKENAITEKTRQKYADMCRYFLLPYFKSYRVSAIATYDVELFIRYMRSPEAKINKTNKRTYSNATVYNAYTLLDGILKHAVKRKMISVNPCNAAEKPQKPQNVKVVFYDDVEIVDMLNALDKETNAGLLEIQVMEAKGTYHPFTLQKKKVEVLNKQLIVYLAINTAARRGEILGLHREDINLENKTINFHRSVLYTRGQGTYLKEGLKTRDSLMLSISDELVYMIQAYYKELDKLFVVSEGVVTANDKLFMTLNKTKNSAPGDCLFPDPISEWFKLFLKRNEMREITFHKLRHSSLSYLLHMGVDIWTVSKIAGHNSIEQIQKTYGHLYENDKAIALGNFSALSQQSRENRAVERELEEIKRESIVN